MSASGLSDEQLRTMQIIAGALLMGVISFAGVAAFMGLEKEAGDPFMAYIAAGFAVLMFVMHLLVPSMIAGAAMKQSGQNETTEDRTGDNLVGIFQTQLIVVMAMLEGAAFFNLVAFIIAVQWWSFAVVGLLLLAMAAKFPTRFKVESWLETKHHELEMGD